MTGIKVLGLGDAEVYEDKTVISRRLVRREHGCEEMSFNVSTLHVGYEDDACVYADYDEIVYILSGKAELTIDGETQTIGAGTAFYVPRGQSYGYKVTEGPHDLIAVFTPAKT